MIARVINTHFYPININQLNMRLCGGLFKCPCPYVPENEENMAVKVFEARNKCGEKRRALQFYRKSKETKI